MDDQPSRLLIGASTTVVALLWAVLDQASKMLVVRTYSTNPPDDLGPVVLRLIYNEGAAFSLPIQLPWLFVAVTVVVLIMVVRALPNTHSVSLAAAYGLLAGGAVGNALDRIFRDGAVVDMIDLDFPPFESFPVFNVADVGITVGAFLVFVFMVVADRREAARDAPVVLDHPVEGGAGDEQADLTSPEVQTPQAQASHVPAPVHNPVEDVPPPSEPEPTSSESSSESSSRFG